MKINTWFRPREGSFGFVTTRLWVHIKAPWSFAYFSERYGYQVPKFKAFGWRVFLKKGQI